MQSLFVETKPKASGGKVSLSYLWMERVQLKLNKCRMQTIKKRHKISISSRLLVIKDWEKKNLSLENSEHHQAQWEITSSQNKAAAASVGMLLLQQVRAAGVPAIRQPALCDLWKAQRKSLSWRTAKKFHCTTEQPITVSGSGTVPQILNSKESYSFPLSLTFTGRDLGCL